MDFEFAAWQMLYLFTSPQRVYRNFHYRKQTKDQWARDDPAFLVLLSIWLCGKYLSPVELKNRLAYRWRILCYNVLWARIWGYLKLCLFEKNLTRKKVVLFLVLHFPRVN
jgi:hypothetical protein